MFVVCCNDNPTTKVECSQEPVIDVTDPYLNLAFHNNLAELKQRIELGEITVDYVDEDNYRHHNTLAHAATAGRAFEVLDFLHSRFVGVSRLNDRGLSAFHLAVLADDRYLLNILCQTFHADINQRTGKGMTPLYLAVVKNKLNSISYLLDVGADQTIVGPSGRTPLQYGVKNNIIPYELSKRFDQS